jgi:hypothetical protein
MAFGGFNSGNQALVIRAHVRGQLGIPQEGLGLGRSPNKVDTGNPVLDAQLTDQSVAKSIFEEIGREVQAVRGGNKPAPSRPASSHRSANTGFNGSSLYQMHQMASYFATLLRAYESLMQGFMMFAGGQYAPNVPQNAPSVSTPAASAPTPPVPKGFKTNHSALFSGAPQQQVEQAKSLVRQHGIGHHGNVTIHQGGFGGRFLVALTDQNGASTTIQIAMNGKDASLITQSQNGVNPSSFEVNNDSARALTFQEFRSFR